MRKNWIIVVLLSAFGAIQAQSVGIGTSTPNMSAILDITSNSKGVLTPRMTSNERVAIPNPQTGLLVYQTNGTPGFYYYNGSKWVNLTTGAEPNSTGYSLSEVMHYAGSGTAGFSNGNLDTAKFNGPVDITMDWDQNFYIVDRGNNCIRKITNGVVTTFAGTGIAGSTDGPGNVASFYYPNGIVCSFAEGCFYVADGLNRKIRRIDENGFVSTVAGTGQFGSLDTIASLATFKFPNRLALSPDGDLYISDVQDNKIRKLSGNVVSTFCNSGLSHPNGIAFSPSGDLYVADEGSCSIKKLSPLGVVTSLSGSYGAPTEGPISSVSFNQPNGLAFSPSGDLYVSEYGGSKIKRIRNSFVTTVAGLNYANCGSLGYLGNVVGPGATALFNSVGGISFNHIDNALMVTDVNNQQIKKIVQ
jgi:sugar lactone lactonase YvrE